MAIIDIFKTERSENAPSNQGFFSEVSFVDESAPPKEEKKSPLSKDALLSFLCVRLLFFVLLLCTLVWFAYTVCKIALFLSLKLCVWGFSNTIKTKLSKSWLSFKRSFICGIALLLSMLSPALGIMIACTYFLMYDKSGVEEVVPASLREQFKDLFAQGDQN